MLLASCESQASANTHFHVASVRMHINTRPIERTTCAVDAIDLMQARLLSAALLVLLSQPRLAAPSTLCSRRGAWVCTHLRVAVHPRLGEQTA